MDMDKELAAMRALFEVFPYAAETLRGTPEGWVESGVTAEDAWEFLEAMSDPTPLPEGSVERVQEAVLRRIEHEERRRKN